MHSGTWVSIFVIGREGYWGTPYNTKDNLSTSRIKSFPNVRTVPCVIPKVI